MEKNPRNYGFSLGPSRGKGESIIPRNYFLGVDSQEPLCKTIDFVCCRCTLIVSAYLLREAWPKCDWLAPQPRAKDYLTPQGLPG